MIYTIVTILLWIVAALPAILWPGVLIANAMTIGSLGGVKHWDTKTILMVLFVVVSTIYPFAFWVCVYRSYHALKAGQPLVALPWALLPAIPALIFLWFLFGKKSRTPRRTK